MTVRKIISPLWLLLLAAGSSSFAVVAGGPKGSSADRPVVSLEQVQAILNSKCVSCHSEETRSSGLSVETRESLIEGGARYGSSVKAGQPGESPLVQILRGELKPLMPFGAPEPLPDADIAVIEKWISGLKPDANGGDDAYWSFVKPVHHDPPAAFQEREWVRNDIDRFVLSQLEEKGFTPAPEAERRVLIRRLYFDLIGLPPSPEKVRLFVEDSSPNAYQGLVGRLLANPGYGERWGRHWLDLARYADSLGYEGDPEFVHAWRYRDYVVDAFNNDKPYDQFVQEQIAGDEFIRVQNASPAPPPEPEKAVALSFLRLAPFNRTPESDENRDALLSEMISTVSSVFLGLTVGCAKCHDHKYDPIPQADFYRMKAFFAPIYIPPNGTGGSPKDLMGGSMPTAFYRLGESERIEKRRAKYEVELEELEAGFAAFQALLLERLKAFKGEGAKRKGRKELQEQVESLEKAIERHRGQKSRLLELYVDGNFDRSDLDDKAKSLNSLIDDRTEELKQVVALLRDLSPTPEVVEADDGAEARAEKERKSTLQDLQKALKEKGTAKESELFSRTERKKSIRFRERIQMLKHALERMEPRAMSVRNADGPPLGPTVPRTHVLFRGKHDSPLEAVEPGFLRVVAGHSKPAELEIDRYKMFPGRGWRMTLAKWITSPENPLTARVMVNRIWQHHFGNGIVSTPSDFGKNGARPTHPELLDWMALGFIEEKWSIKAMHRLIVTSSTYRQSSRRVYTKAEERDPDNRMLWRFNRQRLEGELIRDSVLAVSGRLNRDAGGPPVFPPLPPELTEKQKVQGLDTWNTSEGSEGRKRSIYTFQRRSMNNPFLGVFDAPVLNTSCDRRKISVTALQALSMYGSEFVNNEAVHLAEKVQRESSSDTLEQIQRAFQLVLSRRPNVEEVEQAQSFLTETTAEAEALTGLCRILLNTNEFVYIN